MNSQYLRGNFLQSDDKIQFASGKWKKQVQITLGKLAVKGREIYFEKVKEKKGFIEKNLTIFIGKKKATEKNTKDAKRRKETDEETDLNRDGKKVEKLTLKRLKGNLFL